MIYNLTYTLLLLLLYIPVITITEDPSVTVSSTLILDTKATADTIEWPRPRFEERQKERYQLVNQALAKEGISDSSVLQAMRHVPRHLFIPKNLRPFAYMNRPLPIGHEQTISQPYIVAYMTQILQLEAGEKVLEIGTGSGYQAAVLSEITPHVYTIEIVEELGRQASQRFDSLGYETIETKIGDGYRGWKAQAPFDAIILTAAPEAIPKPLIRQLKKGGVMVLPVGKPGRTQMLTRVTKDQQGEVHIERKLPVRFVPMTGRRQ